jgi:hypothetical protein
LCKKKNKLLHLYMFFYYCNYRMSYSIEGPFIRATFPVMFRLCVGFLCDEYDKWTAEKHQVAEIFHDGIENIFDEILQYLLNIDDTDPNQWQFKFYMFDQKMSFLTHVLDFLKNE